MFSFFHDFILYIVYVGFFTLFKTFASLVTMSEGRLHARLQGKRCFSTPVNLVILACKEAEGRLEGRGEGQEEQEEEGAGPRQ